MQDVDVLDPRVERIISKKARKVFDVPLDVADIEQELRMAVVDYCNHTPVSQRKLSAVTVVVNQKLYKLIREYSKFEGCCEASKETRRNLTRPYSLNQPIVSKTRGCNDQKEDTMLVSLLQSNVDTQSDRLMLKDFIDTFTAGLNETEQRIFKLMLDGINKPRFVSMEIHGHREERMCKIISKYMVSIKEKFKQAWQDEFQKHIDV